MGGVARRPGEQRAQSRAAGCGELLEAGPDDGARLAGHRREVGDGADGGNPREVRHPQPATGEERRRQLVCQPGARQVLIGVGAICAVRVDDRRRARQHRSRQVMVRDDDLKAERTGNLDLGDVGDATVAGDHEAHATLRQRLQPRAREAVSLRPAGRHVAFRLDSQGTQADHPDRDGADAVCVVVAPDRDAIALRDGALDAIEGGLRVRHEGDGVHRRGARLEESRQLLLGAESAAREQGGDRSPETGERRRIEDRPWKEPCEPRHDHGRHGSGVRLSPAAGLVTAPHRLSGRTCRPAIAVRSLRRASHSDQATRIWLALKIDE